MKMRVYVRNVMLAQPHTHTRFDCIGIGRSGVIEEQRTVAHNFFYSSSILCFIIQQNAGGEWKYIMEKTKRKINIKKNTHRIVY